MAQKRMFSLQIVDTDYFLDMPQTAQLLYFHLSMRADDDGFVDNWKKVMKIIGSSEDDYKVLLAKRFLLDFESGVIVIKHWRINNYIQKDRYHETKYLEEKGGLAVKENEAYTKRVQNVNGLDTQSRLGESRLGKARQELEGATPAATPTKSFFEDLNQQQEILNWLVNDKRIPADAAKYQVQKFILYWTEPSKTGKLRWQAEKFFEVKRRLATWFGRLAEFKNNKTNERKIWE